MTCHHQESNGDFWLEQLAAPWKGHRGPQNSKSSWKLSLSSPQAVHLQRFIFPAEMEMLWSFIFQLKSQIFWKTSFCAFILYLPCLFLDYKDAKASLSPGIISWSHPQCAMAEGLSVLGKQQWFWCSPTA